MFVSNSTRKGVKSDIGLTPQKAFNILNQEFNFKLDVATEQDNPLGLENYFTEKDDALVQDGKTNGTVGLNPPFSMCKEFSTKVVEEFKKGQDIVMLVPARFDAKGFKNNVAPYAEVRSFDGRLKFSGKMHAPFCSVICIFSHKRKGFKRKYKANMKYQSRGY